MLWSAQTWKSLKYYLLATELDVWLCNFKSLLTTKIHLGTRDVACVDALKAEVAATPYRAF